MLRRMIDARSYPRPRIFVLCSLALFTAGLSFALRAAIIAAIETEVLREIDPANSDALAGQLLGTPFGLSEDL